METSRGSNVLCPAENHAEQNMLGSKAAKCNT